MGPFDGLIHSQGQEMLHSCLGTYLLVVAELSTQNSSSTLEFWGQRHWGRKSALSRGTLVISDSSKGRASTPRSCIRPLYPLPRVMFDNEVGRFIASVYTSISTSSTLTTTVILGVTAEPSVPTRYSDSSVGYRLTTRYFHSSVTRWEMYTVLISESICSLKFVLVIVSSIVTVLSI